MHKKPSSGDEANASTGQKPLPIHRKPSADPRPCLELPRSVDAPDSFHPTGPTSQIQTGATKCDRETFDLNQS